MKKYLSVGALSLLVSGCASTYQQPTGGNVATISVPKFESDYKFLGGFSGGSVMLAEKNDDGCGKFSRLDDKSSEGKQIIVNINADKEVFISIGRFYGNNSCVINGYFLPEKQKQYAVVFADNYAECGAAVIDTSNPSSAQAIKLTKAFASKWDGLKVCDTATVVGADARPTALASTVRRDGPSVMLSPAGRYAV
ncbi:MAG: hypothetical protein EOO38_01930 [Cytophagaceae bacterium]|nr:MAG: hypothetical protein EOO38_01930 [Cytophagaceae bacterium]